MDIYIDCEWYITQDVFLIGYAHNVREKGQLYDESLNYYEFNALLDKVEDDYIFFYGPDIGMLEKHFSIDIRNNYKCVNLLKVFKQALPHERSYKLAELERSYDIERTSRKYKTSIFEIFKDWKDPRKKKTVLKYNEEDVVNLLRLKKKIFAENGIKRKHLDKVLLK